MVSNANDRDPEILELSHEIHDLTGQIKILVKEINKVSVQLELRTKKATNDDAEGEVK
jgi:hypothetical protein